MNILILEDEKRNYNRIKRLLECIDPSYCVSEPVTSVAEAVDYLQQHEAPDLILADIRLSDGLSFEALRQTAVSSPVIFTTAYDEYAIQAFKYNSFDYLLKPIDEKELAAAIEKVRTQARMPQEDNIQQLIEQMQRNNYKYRERFLLPYRDGYKSVRTDDLAHICLVNKATCLFLRSGGSAFVSFSMNELEMQLNPDKFFRANRQYIIHIDSIERISNYFNSGLLVHLKGYPDEKIIVSREKAVALKEWLDK